MARQQQQQQNNCFQLLRMLEFAKFDSQHWKNCHMAMFSMALMALLSVECHHHVCRSQLWFVAGATALSITIYGEWQSSSVLIYIRLEEWQSACGCLQGLWPGLHIWSITHLYLCCAVLTRWGFTTYWDISDFQLYIFICPCINPTQYPYFAIPLFW